jgi:hypothetical protein
MVLAVIFGFTCQALLLAFFAAHRWRPEREAVLGSLVYAMGIPAAALAVAYLVLGVPGHWPLAFGLYAAWAALGAWLDILRPIEWRVPPRWPILVSYALLLMAALFAFWIPLWWIDRGLWIAFGILYAAHTTLNIVSHRGGQTRRGSVRR